MKMIEKEQKGNNNQHLVYIALGSNLGNKEHNIIEAEKHLEQYIGKIIISSSSYNTKPIGFVSQNNFINKVICIHSTLSPEEILIKTSEIEKVLGRTNKSDCQQYVDRVIDIDILYYDDIILNNSHLIIPHPEMHKRRFVMLPLSEIAASKVHPILLKTSKELLENLSLSEN